MSAIANLTVKMSNGTTDIVYTALQPASGDGGYAIWRQEDTNVMAGQRPVLKMTCRDNGPKTARKVHLEFARPFTYTDSTTGLAVVKDRILGSADFLLPQEVTDTAIAEAVHQFTNLLVALRDDIKAGISPT